MIYLKHSRFPAVFVLLFLAGPLAGGSEVDGETGPCVICHEDCPIGEHVAANDGFSAPLLPIWHRNGGAHNGLQCLTGSCATKHGPDTCGGAMLLERDLRELEEAAARDQTDRIEVLLRRYPVSLVHNVRRNAMQVFDCQGTVMAHIPLSQAAENDLAE